MELVLEPDGFVVWHADKSYQIVLLGCLVAISHKFVDTGLHGGNDRPDLALVCIPPSSAWCVSVCVCALNLLTFFGLLCIE